MKVSLDDLMTLEKASLITVREHATERLFIANYTPKTQFDKLWDRHPLLPQCRGLIFDGDGEVVGRPFPKFFNIGEHQGPIPDGEIEVTDKLDGSLGVVYFADGEPCIATRGSFESDQARVGTGLLRDAMRFVKKPYPFIDGKTYLFEIIYPDNRVVVDYGQRRELVQLAVIDNETGLDVGIADWGIFQQPAIYRVESIEELLALPPRPNAEGYVIHWPATGFRLKLKHDEYVRLHRLLTGVTPRRAWEVLAAGEGVERWLENVPDEFAAWVNAEVKSLNDGYRQLDRDYAAIFASQPHCADRKEFASFATAHDCSDVLFRMYDKREYGQLLWKRLRPGPARPFREPEV